MAVVKLWSLNLVANMVVLGVSVACFLVFLFSVNGEHPHLGLKMMNRLFANSPLFYTYCGWTPNRTMFFRPFAKSFARPNVGCSGPAHEKKSDRRQKLCVANDANVFRLFYQMSLFTPLRFFLFPQKLSVRPALGRADPTLGQKKSCRKPPKILFYLVSTHDISIIFYTTTFSLYIEYI